MALKRLKSLRLPRIDWSSYREQGRARMQRMKQMDWSLGALWAKGKTKVKESSYPFIPFHSIRCAQLVSSIIVTGIMSYFLWWLHHDGYSSPWTFTLLLSVSVLTVISLIGTIMLHLFYGLNPALNLYLNGGLSVIWALGFCLLSWWSSRTLGHVCSKTLWVDSNGMMVCRTYKALYAFTVFGFFSTVAASLLDYYVFKRSTRHGVYSQMTDPDNKTMMDPNSSTFALTAPSEFELQPPYATKAKAHTGGYDAGHELTYDSGHRATAENKV